MTVCLDLSPQLRARLMATTPSRLACGDTTSLSIGIMGAKGAQTLLMKKRFGTFARLMAVAVLVLSNASFVIAGAVVDTARNADANLFADGYVICTPNGMIIVAAGDLGFAGRETDQAPATGWAGPVCPDCILGSATAAPVSPCIAARSETPINIRYSEHAVRPHSGAVLAAYDSRAPPS